MFEFPLKLLFGSPLVLLREYLQKQFPQLKVTLGTGTGDDYHTPPSCVIICVPMLLNASDGVAFYLDTYKEFRSQFPNACIIWIPRDQQQVSYYRPSDFKRSIIIPAEGGPHPKGALTHLAEAIKEAVYWDKVNKGMPLYDEETRVSPE